MKNIICGKEDELIMRRNDREIKGFNEIVEVMKNVMCVDLG